MICIAVFRDHTSRELSWSLFISDDPEYKHKVTLYTIEPTTSHWRVGRTSWRQRETSESLRGRRDLICVIELPQCTWTPGQLRVFIQHELRRPEAGMVSCLYNYGELNSHDNKTTIHIVHAGQQPTGSVVL